MRWCNLGFWLFLPTEAVGPCDLWWPLWAQVGRAGLVCSWLEAEATEAERPRAGGWAVVWAAGRWCGGLTEWRGGSRAGLLRTAGRKARAQPGSSCFICLHTLSLAVLARCLSRGRPRGTDLALVLCGLAWFSWPVQTLVKAGVHAHLVRAFQGDTNAPEAGARPTGLRDSPWGSGSSASPGSRGLLIWGGPWHVFIQQICTACLPCAESRTGQVCPGMKGAYVTVREEAGQYITVV